MSRTATFGHTSVCRRREELQVTMRRPEVVVSTRGSLTVRRAEGRRRQPQWRPARLPAQCSQGVEDDSEVDRFLEEGACDRCEVSGGGDGHGGDAESHPGEYALSRDVE